MTIKNDAYTDSIQQVIILLSKFSGYKKKKKKKSSPCNSYILMNVNAKLEFDLKSKVSVVNVTFDMRGSQVRTLNKLIHFDLNFLY